MIPPAVKTIAYRASITALVEQLNPALAITLAFNRDTTPASAAEDLKHLHARLDRLVLGRLWAKRVDDRSTYIAVIEHVDTNLHIHLALSCAPEHVDRIRAAMAAIGPIIDTLDQAVLAGEFDAAVASAAQARAATMKAAKADKAG